MNYYLLQLIETIIRKKFFNEKTLIYILVVLIRSIQKKLNKQDFSKSSKMQ